MGLPPIDQFTAILKALMMSRQLCSDDSGAVGWQKLASYWGKRMNDLIRIATAELARFLASKLPDLSTEWWQQHVVNRLSFQQQRMLQERGFQTLQQLDFAALLRVLDQNWYELSNACGLPREGRTWVRELQTVRNRWAHLSAEAPPDSEIYRDADTLGRL